MGLHATIDREKGEVDVWGCVTSGCVRYEEGKDSVYASLEDRRKDGLEVEKRLSLKKRKGYGAVVEAFFNDDLLSIGGYSLPSIGGYSPQADEEELLEAFRFVVERKRNTRYVGLKLEYVSPRGIQVYYRLRSFEQSDGVYIVVELSAKKDGESISYNVYGKTTNGLALQHEAAKAIGAYVLFANFISQQTEQDSAQQA